MDVQKFFKIIQKHFEKDNVSNFHGIEIVPYYKQTEDRIKFGFKNPNDLSFNYNCLTEHFWEQCEFIGRLIGILDKKNSAQLHKYIKIDFKKGNTLYFNKSDKKKIDELFNSVTYFELGPTGMISIESDLEFVKGDIYAESNQVDISAKYIFKNIRNKNRQFDYDTNLEYLRNWVYDDFGNYDEISYRTLSPVISFVEDNPLTFYHHYMYTNANITPIAYKSDGSILEI